MTTSNHYFSRNNHFISFSLTDQIAQSVRILLDVGSELRVEHRSWTHNSRTIRLVLVYLRDRHAEPYGGIPLIHNFHLRSGALFLAPFDPNESQTTWTWLEEESARNNHAYPHEAPAAGAHDDPFWGAATWPVLLPAPTFEWALPAIRALIPGVAPQPRRSRWLSSLAVTVDSSVTRTVDFLAVQLFSTFSLLIERCWCF